MNRIIALLLTLICLVGSGQINSKDPFQFGVKLGMSWHNATGGLTKVPLSASFLGGIWMRIKLSERWTGQTEVIFNEKGGGNIDHDAPRQGQYSVKLFYLEMPILFQFHYRKAIFEAGPCAGIRTYQYEVLARTYPVDLSPYYPFKSAELAVNVGARYAFNSRWHIDLRFSHSIFPVREQITRISDAVYNRVLAFSVNRRLGGRKRTATS